MTTPIWQGYRHRWARFSHRLSAHGMGLWGGGIRVWSELGRDGDRASVEVGLTHVTGALGASGVTTLPWLSDVENGHVSELAAADRIHLLESLAPPPPGMEHVAILDGYWWRTNRAERLQSVWLVRFDLALTIQGGNKLVVTLDLAHADSPDKLKSPPPGPVGHEFTIAWRVCQRPIGSVARHSETVAGHALRSDPRAGTRPQSPGHVTAVSGFGWALNGQGATPGRYLRAFDFSAEPEPDQSSVRTQVGVSAGISVRETTYAAHLDLVSLPVDSTRSEVRTLGFNVSRLVGTDPIEHFVPVSPGSEPRPDADYLISKWQSVIQRKPSLPKPAVGSSQVGVARVSLDLDSLNRKLPLTGYGMWASGTARHSRLPMYVRAMLFSDAAGERVVFLTYDLHSASRPLHERIAEQTHALGLSVDRVVVMGTHTHTGPGGYYGNGLHELFAAHQSGFDAALVAHLVACGVKAVQAALANSRPATVRVDTPRVWGVGRNRSVGAFRLNAEAPGWNTRPGAPGVGAPAGLGIQELATDPRLVVLSAFDATGKRFGVFSTFACHNTALGLSRAKDPEDEKHEDKDHLKGELSFDPDWVGRAAATVEASGVEVAIVALSGAGDQTPLPAGIDDKKPVRHLQGPTLAAARAGAISNAIVALNAQGAVGSKPVALHVAYKDWWTSPRAPHDRTWQELDGVRLEKWAYGASALGGAEDGRSGFWPTLAREGMTGHDFPAGHLQHPKQLALGLIQVFARLGGPLAPSPLHPLHVIHVSGHVFATVPGEPTVRTAYDIESHILSVSEASTASVIGYAGDYSGYYASAAEYALQQYEGASTLYGSRASDHLRHQLVELAAARDLRTVEPLVPGFHGDRHPVPPPTSTGWLEAQAIRAAWSVTPPPPSSTPAVEVVELRDGARHKMPGVPTVAVVPSGDTAAVVLVGLSVSGSTLGRVFEVTSPYGTVRVPADDTAD